VAVRRRQEVCAGDGRGGVAFIGGFYREFGVILSGFIVILSGFIGILSEFGVFWGFLSGFIGILIKLSLKSGNFECFYRYFISFCEFLSDFINIWGYYWIILIGFQFIFRDKALTKISCRHFFFSTFSAVFSPPFLMIFAFFLPFFAGFFCHFSLFFAVFFAFFLPFFGDYFSIQDLIVWMRTAGLPNFKKL
jgi:hypothetical protein